MAPIHRYNTEQRAFVPSTNTWETGEVDYVRVAILQPQIIAHFLEAAKSGRMPGNKQTTLRLLPVEEFNHHFKYDYRLWASAEHRSLRGSPHNRITRLIAEQKREDREIIVDVTGSALMSKVSIISFV